MFLGFACVFPVLPTRLQVRWSHQLEWRSVSVRHSPKDDWIPTSWKVTNGQFQFLLCFWNTKQNKTTTTTLFASLFISWLHEITWKRLTHLKPNCFLKWDYSKLCSCREIPRSPDAMQWLYSWQNWGSEIGSGLQLRSSPERQNTENDENDCLQFSHTWYIACTIIDWQEKSSLIIYKGCLWTLGLIFSLNLLRMAELDSRAVSI